MCLNNYCSFTVLVSHCAHHYNTLDETTKLIYENLDDKQHVLDIFLEIKKSIRPCRP